jgi:hypothetical protein
LITRLRPYDRRVSEYQPSDIRVSDTEREDALNKLGEHMSAGRLDLEEYGERTAKVATAKTRGELLGLFGDLPEPKPIFGHAVPAAPAEPVPRPSRSIGQRVAPVLVPVVGIAAIVVLIAVVKLPFFFLFPVLFFAFGSSWWRGDRGHNRHYQAIREHRREIRDHHRRTHGRWRDDRY